MPLLDSLNNRLLSFQHSNFSDIVDLRIISYYCSKLNFLAVNAAAVVLSEESYSNDNPVSQNIINNTTGLRSSSKEDVCYFLPYLKGNNCNIFQSFLILNSTLTITLRAWLILTFSFLISEIRLNIHAIIPKHVWTCLFIECKALEDIDITSPESMTDNHLLSIVRSQDTSDYQSK